MPRTIDSQRVCAALAAWALIAASPLVSSALAQTQYRTAQEAFNAGAKLHNARQFAESRAPFETALQLSQDSQFKVRTYRALMEAYRQLPDIGKMLEATDYIFEHGRSSTEKSLIARSLTSFVHERGKKAEAVQIYEGRLKQNPKDKPALYALVEIYHRAEPNPKRRAELQTVLAEVQKNDEAELAVHYEKLASEQRDQAATHWKDATAAWLRAGDKAKATAAIKKAEETGPESRNDLLAHFWHKAMGDAYLELEQPKEAIPHFEQAIKKTNIQGYIKSTEKQLEKARAAVRVF